jgi:FdhE protein
MLKVLDPAQIEAFATQRTIPRIRLPDSSSVFSARAARLRQISAGHAVGDYLRLMAALADAQQSALDARADSDWRVVLGTLCEALAAASGFPDGVKATCERVRALSAKELEDQVDLLLSNAIEGVDAQAAPFIMAALQVCQTRTVCDLSPEDVTARAAAMHIPGSCPMCGALPVASIVRADKAYQGYRYLHCSVCASEWHLVRVKCSHCDSTEGITYHTIEGGAAAVRAEACDSCKTYRKICYQEQDMQVEPVADDLGSLALDLLMSEAGFHRGSGNPLLWQAF